MKTMSVLALGVLLGTPAIAEVLQGSTQFTLDKVEALQLTGSPSTNPDQQQACETQLAGTGADGDINNGVLQVDYEINTDTMMMSATGDYSYAGGSESAKLDQFFTLGISGVYAFMDTDPKGALADDYGVERVGFTLNLDAAPESAYMLIAGGADFMCKLSN